MLVPAFPQRTPAPLPQGEGGARVARAGEGVSSCHDAPSIAIVKTSFPEIETPIVSTRLTTAASLTSVLTNVASVVVLVVITGVVTDTP